MTPTLTTTDPIMDLGRKVLGMLAEGYDGEQITQLGCTVEQAEQALRAYVARVLHGTAPKAMPAPECGPANPFDGWCYKHGVFHVDVEPTSIDPTLRGSCATHGPDVAMAYLGNERYGCWHCNPTRPAPKPAPPSVPPPAEPVGEIPAWMLGEDA